MYSNNITLWKKIETIAQEIYGASEVMADTKIRDQLKKMQDDRFGKLPICIAKTQYSFSTDPNLKGAPKDHVLPIREIKPIKWRGIYSCNLWIHYDNARTPEGTCCKFY